MLIEKLSYESGLPSNRLRFFAQTASNRYFLFSIPKRSGGERRIAHPARPLKAVQRWLNSRYFSKLAIHPSAMAYRKGTNIRMNAEAHAKSAFTLRVDFRDFFPNFSILNVYQYLKDHQDLLAIDDRDLQFVSQIVCRYDGLTIGAPSSPVLTNAMMYSFDQCISEYCERVGLVYTRYADDVFISSNEANALGEAYQVVKGAAAAFPYADLKVNGKKTAFLSRKYRRRITGLVITPQGQVSIGRDRKREVKSLVYQLLNSSISTEKIEYLKGLLSFISDVEPSFLNSLTEKYGETYLWILYQGHSVLPTTFSALETIDPSLGKE